MRKEKKEFLKKSKTPKRSAKRIRQENIMSSLEYHHPMVPIFTRENFDKKKYKLLSDKAGKAAVLYHYFSNKSEYYKYLSKYKNKCFKMDGEFHKAEFYFILKLRAKALLNRYRVQRDAMEPWFIEFNV